MPALQQNPVIPGYGDEYKRLLEQANPVGVLETKSGEPLTLQESMFIYFYINTGNAVEAFQKAGFTYPRETVDKATRVLASADNDIEKAVKKEQSRTRRAERKKQESRAAIEKKKEELKKQYITIPSYIEEQLEKDPDKYLEPKTHEEYMLALMYSAHSLLRMPQIKHEFDARVQAMKDAAKADADEVFRYFTAVMRGQVKDQFGLEASLQERTRAAECLAKRLIDIPKRMQVSGSVGGQPVQLVIAERQEEEPIDVESTDLDTDI